MRLGPGESDLGAEKTVHWEGQDGEAAGGTTPSIIHLFSKQKEHLHLLGSKGNRLSRSFPVGVAWNLKRWETDTMTQECETPG